jgi:uncharacterized protein DUF6298
MMRLMRMRLVLCLMVIGGSLLAQRSASGPLRQLPSNPRWFTDGSGKAVYLAGSHIWYNLQDNGALMLKGGDPPPEFDYDGFLKFLERYNHNFFRLWRWEVPKWSDRAWTDAQRDGVAKYCQPHPWERTGPGEARDGKPKFDVTRFNQAYFDRLRSRVIAARDRGMYVSVMLFEGWGSQFTDAWEFHPFQAANNVNGVDGDAMGYFMVQKTAMGKKVLDLQEAYIRRVIDTVNDLDNVLYEVCNEAGPYSTAWQYHVIRYVKQYEAAKPKQHPVGMTFQYRAGLNSTLFESPADWVSPNPGSPEENYRDNPTPDTKGKVVVSDTDHLWGHTGGDAVWVWKSFTRGLNVLLMEEFTPSPTWQDSAREAMGQARRYAEKMDLAAMTPATELCSTGYCLAAKGREYLAFMPGSPGQFNVNLTDVAGGCSVEWLNVTTGKTVAGQEARGGAQRTFATPFGGLAVLYLKCGG